MGGSLDDEAMWVARAQAGDVDAYGELVRRHQRAAIRVAAAVAGSNGAADAAQEGFLRAHRALHRFDPARPFRPWLLRIVANAAKNEVRSSVRHLRLADRAREVRVELAIHEHDGPEPDDRRALIDALSMLSRDDRLILALRWFEDLTEAEIAEVMELRRGTVKSRLSRAMARLRIELTPETERD